MVRLLSRSKRASSAVEFALVLPLFMIILFGAVEIGSYFYYEHLLVKSLRDGARYAARQDYSNFTCGSPVAGTTLSNTRALVQTSLLSGGTNRMPMWNATTITMSVDCYTTALTDPVGNVAAASQNMAGIYTDKVGGAPVVKVEATVPYVPMTGAMFGFNSNGMTLRGSQQAVVTGI